MDLCKAFDADSISASPGKLKFLDFMSLQMGLLERRTGETQGPITSPEPRYFIVIYHTDQPRPERRHQYL
ncbi:hypothetical protein PHYBLDRAFT_143696 [Phycomyces blakesleeanus NRRL 1555(-)]|uniref:Uncharacterized protein n=1 Tax=Phycomyces blakesleeanus (strain ATCC 8743b / DSM 1359 / FGSC 10004 / NBRC 33097 / NRRL 1555) TaxID=763407 RepID=A0A162XKC3_PHYB8|nr:hypothetical protein PHYBLDRAFT_143696 [Phycomyces blakesleeanus NRRL 1555(-)]OAD75455.1 hypothetical protein PHYBLDRAFT_143696 [Phycomyces blakesleeanus NRRL 1555(-)]|eukprot:XP_018293495.1 hypothetical protein PHYBLDRAFT_143696 [Phycomyces blakesleeanus NRRL 1555(-)]